MTQKKRCFRFYDIRFDDSKINRKNRDRPGGHVNQGHFNHVLLDYVDNSRWSKNLMRRHERREGKADLRQRVDEYYIGTQLDWQEEQAEWIEFQEWLEFGSDQIEDDYNPNWDYEYGYDDWDDDYEYPMISLDEHDGYGIPEPDLNPNKYGRRNVPKMINQINELRFLIRQEGTPAIQEA